MYCTSFSALYKSEATDDFQNVHKESTDGLQVGYIEDSQKVD